MILIDSNILIDLLEANGRWFAWSRRYVAKAEAEDQLFVSTISLAETADHFKSVADQAGFIASVNAHIADLDSIAAFRAGRAHRAYRRAGGPRTAILADFLIGGHAATLMTRDRKRFASYFPDLFLLTPETHP